VKRWEWEQLVNDFESSYPILRQRLEMSTTFRQIYVIENEVLYFEQQMNDPEDEVQKKLEELEQRSAQNIVYLVCYHISNNIIFIRII